MITAPALDEHRTTRISPLLSPALLRHEHPIDAAVADTVTRARTDVVDILDGRDDRLLVVVGPCSIHDPAAALDYAHRLAAHAARLPQLRIVMRTYFEKPRSTVGWKGLINDPALDGSFDVNTGLRTARRLLLQINALGLPVGCEFLDPITPQYLADVVTWGSIGARTAASQVHRQLCSGLSMPVGIKNGTDGDVQVAVDGVGAAGASHVFMGINADGLAALVTTAGNPDCHVILRGGSTGPNHDAASVAGLPPGAHSWMGTSVVIEQHPHGIKVRSGTLPCLAGSGTSRAYAVARLSGCAVVCTVVGAGVGVNPHVV